MLPCWRRPFIVSGAVGQMYQLYIQYMYGVPCSLGLMRLMIHPQHV